MSRWEPDGSSLSLVARGSNAVFRFHDAAGAARYLRLTADARRPADQLLAEL